jgi:hypothetical protein
MSKPRTSPKWCVCGFKRHGKNHDKGEHHQRWVKKQEQEKAGAL